MYNAPSNIMCTLELGLKKANFSATRVYCASLLLENLLTVFANYFQLTSFVLWALIQYFEQIVSSQKPASITQFKPTYIVTI